MDEYNFTCELCRRTFPADPNTMLEAKLSQGPWFEMEGRQVPIPDEVIELEATHVEHLGDHGICICLPCQSRLNLI